MITKVLIIVAMVVIFHWLRYIKHAIIRAFYDIHTGAIKDMEKRIQCIEKSMNSCEDCAGKKYIIDD